ncbi:hypothetical protein [Salinirubrum litoreum]|uniref:DUF5673 domain-containing protein n=1 Tax=Salinirubrum litoreum TaxID=1126234 RepID=A0ABD5RFT4_9EURY|nr:hypothetical protein [Salinirubrum litoreum]
MRPRLPSLDWFSVACGVLVAGIVVAVGSSTGRVVIGLAALAGLTTWTLLEQFPHRVDRLVLARAHWLAGVLAVALVAVALLGRTGLVAVPGSATIPVLGLSLLAVFVLGSGGTRRGTVIRRESTVRVVLQAEKSRRYALATMAVGLLGTTGLVSPLFGDPVVPSLLGAGLGALIASVFTWTPSVELTATDRALLVADRPRGGAEVISWRRVRAISTEGSTVRVRRSLPTPMVYTATVESPAEADAQADALRRCRRAVVE